MSKNNNYIILGTTFTNCLFWVVWKRLTKGGKIKWRKAKSRIPYPHFMWVDPYGTKIYDVVPKKGSPTFPYVVFYGIIRVRNLKL